MSKAKYKHQFLFSFSSLDDDEKKCFRTAIAADDTIIAGNHPSIRIGPAPILSGKHFNAKSLL